MTAVVVLLEGDGADLATPGMCSGLRSSAADLQVMSQNTGVLEQCLNMSDLLSSEI